MLKRLCETGEHFNLASGCNGMKAREAALRRAQERLRERGQSGLRSKLGVPSVGSVFSGLLSQSDLPSVPEMSPRVASSASLEFEAHERLREQALQPLNHTAQISLAYETLPFAPAGGAKEGEYPRVPLNPREIKQDIPPLLQNSFLNSSAQLSTHMSSTQMPDASLRLPAAEAREYSMRADSGGVKWRDDLMSRAGNASAPQSDTDLSPRTLILAACSPQKSREPSTFPSSHAQSLQPALVPVAIYVRGAGLNAGIHCALPYS